MGRKSISQILIKLPINIYHKIPVELKDMRCSVPVHTIIMLTWLLAVESEHTEALLTSVINITVSSLLQRIVTDSTTTNGTAVNNVAKTFLVESIMFY